MTSNRNLRRGIALAVALLVAGCAATGGDQAVTTITTQEAVAPPVPVDNLGIAVLQDTFAAKGSNPTATTEYAAASANQHVHTLLPALLEAIPRVFSAAGVHAAPVPTEHLHGDQILAGMGRFDYVLLLTPRTFSGRRGLALSDLTMSAQLLDRNRAPVWRGEVALSTFRVNSPDSPMYHWGAAMADDAARALFAHLAKAGFVQAGPPVAQSVDPAAFRGSEQRVLQERLPAPPEPAIPAALAAVQIQSPAGADLHLFDHVDQVRAALPAAPAPQIAVGRVQTLWDQKDGIVVHFADGVATDILYDPRSKATIPALDLALGRSIGDFEAKLGAGKVVSARERSWPLDARRELAALFSETGSVQNLQVRVRANPQPW